jgi:hypothetical protein
MHPVADVTDVPWLEDAKGSEEMVDGIFGPCNI